MQKKNEAISRTEKIQIRLLPKEKELWSLEANRREMNLSEFIRMQVNNSIIEDEEREKVDKKFISELIQLVEKLKNVLSEQFSSEFSNLEQTLSEEPPFSWDL
ncbi:MAG: hypothetical protein ACTSVI_13880 [Promethearchaeota archaeon]